MKTRRAKFSHGHPFARPLPSGNGARSKDKRSDVLVEIFWQLVERYRLARLVGREEFWMPFALNLFMDCAGAFPKPAVGRPKRNEQAGSLERLTELLDCECAIVTKHPEWSQRKIVGELVRQMRRRFGKSARTIRRWHEMASVHTIAILGAKLAATRKGAKPGSFGELSLEMYDAYPGNSRVRGQ